MLARHANGLARIEQPHVCGFAHHHRLGEGEDAGERDVEERQDADRRGLDHVLAEAVEVAGACAAGIDEGRDAAGARDQLGLDTQRGTAPVDVRVQVDQTRRHDLARDVACVLAREAVADRGDLAAGEGDVGHLVDSLRGIDDAATLEDQIVHARFFLPTLVTWTFYSTRVPSPPRGAAQAHRGRASRPSVEAPRASVPPRRAPRRRLRDGRPAPAASSWRGPP